VAKSTSSIFGRAELNGLVHCAVGSCICCSSDGYFSRHHRPTSQPITCFACLQAPWLYEPDKLTFNYKGYACLIKRTPLGVLNGYVDIPMSIADSLDPGFLERLTVHGGITYSAKDDDDAHRIGFDCAHAGDLVPGLMCGTYEYRNIDYVKKEIEGLVDQIQTSLGHRP
jgi:hypothetical protein